jgi:hypothetical protein
MTKKEIIKSLKPLIDYKNDRLSYGFWNDGAPGLQAIDKTLRAFGVGADRKKIAGINPRAGGVRQSAEPMLPHLLFMVNQ